MVFWLYFQGLQVEKDKKEQELLEMQKSVNEKKSQVQSENLIHEYSSRF